MNKTRRNIIKKLISDLEAAKESIEQVAEEEREYVDNMPENLQQSEKAEKAEDATAELEEAISNLESVIDNLTNSIED